MYSAAFLAGPDWSKAEIKEALEMSLYACFIAERYAIAQPKAEGMFTVFSKPPSRKNLYWRALPHFAEDFDINTGCMKYAIYCRAVASEERAEPEKK